MDSRVDRGGASGGGSATASGASGGAGAAGASGGAAGVSRALRDDIIRGVHAPGTRLAEETLSARYGVSRVPVREALRTLEAEGFGASWAP